MVTGYSYLILWRSFLLDDVRLYRLVGRGVRREHSVVKDDVLKLLDIQIDVVVMVVLVNLLNVLLWHRADGLAVVSVPPHSLSGDVLVTVGRLFSLIPVDFLVKELWRALVGSSFVSRVGCQDILNALVNNIVYVLLVCEHRGPHWVQRARCPDPLAGFFASLRDLGH